MEDSKTPYQFNLDKEQKRHKSAHIPAGSEAYSKIFPKDISVPNGPKPNNDFFRIKSTSIFAYQEIDKYSSFCDNEDKIKGDEINILNEEVNNKDEYNNCSTSFSMEINDDSLNSANFMKMKSEYDVIPDLSQYFENANGGNNFPFDEITNSNYIPFNKRRNTQKINRNYFNSIFNNNINNNNNQNNSNNQEQLNNNFEKRKKANSLVYPKGYNNNYNNNINYINNNFCVNNPYNGNNIEDIKDKNEIIDNEDLKEKNDNDNNDLILNTNDIVRKKSNSFANKGNNNMYGQMNQINFPYQQNKNKFFPPISKISSKSHKYLNHHDLYLAKKSNIYFICQDQSNCRNIQDQLEQNKNDVKYIQNFIEQIKPNLINIMMHQFGNYVIQKLLEILIYQENKTLFTEIMIILDKNNSLYSISINNYGTRVIQKTLEKLIESGYNKIETMEINNCIKNLIANHLYDLCRDKNGNHVYQKLLKVYHNETEEINNFLYDYLADIALDVALLQQGATIYTTAINFGTYNQKEKICNKIIQDLDKLINNKYGNYSVQAIINSLKDEKKLIEQIYKYISSNIVELSKQKYSSNVIDTFIMKKDEFSKMIIDDIIKNNQVKDIIKDQYGNYVIQKAMSISDSNTLNKIVEQIKPIVPELLLSNLGKKILNKLMQQYNIRFQEGNC